MTVRPDKIAVLVVDDQPANLLAMDAALHNPTYDLVFANSGAEALERMAEREYAVILLDVQMPQLDGYATARRIRALEGQRHAPIIFVTANYSAEAYMMQGYESGAVDYLYKPLNIDMLRAKVSAFVELFRKTREIEQRSQALLERELAQTRLAGERRYRNLVEGIRDGIVWAADMDLRRFRFVSRYARRISGYPVESWLNEEGFWEGHLHPDEREHVMAAFAKIREGNDFVLEHRFLKASGETIWLQTGAHIEENGNATELRGLSVDVTHLKETESALRRALRARDEFLSIASHELRTPITPLQLQMQGFIRLIETGKIATVPENRLKEMLELSDAQVGRMSRLITQLLDVSRIDSGRFMLDMNNTSIAELVRKVLEHMQHEIAAAECRIELRLDDGVVTRVDRSRIEQVLTNLIGNALKYGTGRPIEISLRQVDGMLRLAIHDHGIGIDRKDQQRIFERFERAVSASHYAGLGLGLYISSQIVELHQGTIWVESEEGRGATFTVELPIIQQTQGSA